MPAFSHFATDPTLNKPPEGEVDPQRDTTDWEDCTPAGDRGVLKKVIKPGNAAAGVPIDGWCAKVNYDAYIEGGWFHGRKVDTTRDRAEEDGDYQFLVGDKNEAVAGGWVIRGLNFGCLNMHRGETAELIIAPEYAYGAKGNKSRPKIPPNATLRFVVDMLTWSPALSDEKNMLDMPWWERLELAHATKESANEHFREGQPEEARTRYWKAGMLMDVIGNPGTEVEMPAEKIEEQNALAITCWLNEAMCYIKMAQNEEATGKNYKGAATGSSTNPTLWRKAIESCEVVFKLDADNVKGHYRKGMALAHLHEFESAKEHFEIAKRGNPASREIRTALERLRLDKAEKEAEDKAMFQKALKKSKGLYSERPDLEAIAAEPVGGSSSSAMGSASARREIELVNPRVWLEMSIGSEVAGRVVLELWMEDLPKTSENFRQLCTGEKGMHPMTRRPLRYKGSPIHRVVEGMCIQGGDIVRGSGVGGESIYGGFFADEGFETKHTEAGLLCMANQGRDTNRSQFYITTGPAPHLDGRHVVFGKVVEGMDVVRRIEAVPTTGERPNLPVTISDCGELETER